MENRHVYFSFHHDNSCYFDFDNLFPHKKPLLPSVVTRSEMEKTIYLFHGKRWETPVFI